jgi:hypothetical protein
LTAPHLVTMAGEWALWRDIAVRTAGFPVSGLDIFGSRDEQAALRAVARDPLFQTAVTWQNRAAMRNAVAKIAAGAPTSGSAQRRREEVVASYWQRYCAKNDTIGFFGPLAWGRVVDGGPTVGVSCGRLVSECTVQFEAWAIQALAEALDADLAVPVGPRSERDLRTQLEQSPPGLRARRLAALDRLGPARQQHSPTTRRPGRSASTSQRTCRSQRPAWLPSTRATTYALSATSIQAPTRWARACSPPATQTRTVSSAR